MAKIDSFSSEQIQRVPKKIYGANCVCMKSGGYMRKGYVFKDRDLLNSEKKIKSSF
jgi:hypothetical protein